MTNDLVGKVIGSLYVSKELGAIKNHRMYECVCDCGRTVLRRRYQLISNLNPTCRFCATKVTSAVHTTHGMYKSENKNHPWHNWVSMVRRANTSTGTYAHVTIYEEWKMNYEAFIAHIGEKPYPEATVDRIDNDLGYIPGNVRWASKADQSRNRTNIVWVVVHGERLPMKTACRKLNIPYTKKGERMIRDGDIPGVYFESDWGHVK